MPYEDIKNNVRRDVVLAINQKERDTLSNTIYYVLEAHHITSRKEPDLRKRLFRDFRRDPELSALFSEAKEPKSEVKKEVSEQPRRLADIPGMMEGARQNEYRQKKILGKDYE